MDYGNPIKKINNVSVANIPSSLKEVESDVSASDAGRDLAGTMHKEMIGSSRKFELAFNNINTATVNYLCGLIKVDEYITVQMLDPMEGTAANGYLTTATYYVGDRTATLYSSHLDIWSDLTFSIIEQGVH